MRVISAVLLAMLGGNNSPSAADVKKILSSVGVEADADELSRVLKELEGKDVAELMEAGRKKLQAVPSGGGGGAAPAAGGAAPAGGGAKKEEKKEEPSEEDEDMGFSLFD